MAPTVMIPDVDAEARMTGVAGGPPPMKAVRLGRVRPKALPPVPRLARYLAAGAAPTPPATVDYAGQAQNAMRRMYLNDRYGCCVISGKAHLVGVFTGNDDTQGDQAALEATDQEIQSIYFYFSPRDRGCVITEVLDYWRDRGITFGGRVTRIDGYVAVDHTNKLEVQVATYLFAGLTLGINLPEEWANAARPGFVWRPTRSGVVGGHDVCVVGYDEVGVQVCTWGVVGTIAWEAFTDRRWVEECYAHLSPDWYGADKVAGHGIDVARLKADLEQLGGGVLPDIDPVVPPAPVVPPTPVPPPPAAFPNYAGTVTLRLPVFGSISGTVTLSPAGVSAALPHGLDGWLKVAASAGQLLLDVGARNWGAVVGDLIRLAKDVGIDLPFAAGLTAAAPELRVPYWKLALDVWRLVSDFRSGNYAAIPGDLAQIAADLGIELPGV